MAGLGVSAEAGRLEGDVAMETNRGVGEAVAVGGDDSTLAAREELAAIGHPGAAGHLEERAGTVNEERHGSCWGHCQRQTSYSLKNSGFT